MIDLVALVFWIALAVAAIAALWLKVMRQQCPECMQWNHRDAVRCHSCRESLV